MAKLYHFPNKFRKRLGLEDLFSSEDIAAFKKYFTDADNWQHDGKQRTLYDGYPKMFPCDPIRSDMVWYVSNQGYGTWVINQSKKEIAQEAEMTWGWSPFVWKSTVPVHEPFNLRQKEMRNHIAWIVDEDGYGQYGLVTNGGDLWVPHARPDNWSDHNAAFGN
jgi:hypothetical protein